MIWILNEGMEIETKTENGNTKENPIFDESDDVANVNVFVSAIVFEASESPSANGYVCLGT